MKRRGSRGRYTALPLPEEKIVAGYHAGESIQNLATDYEVSEHRIRSIFRQRGVVTRKWRSQWSVPSWADAKRAEIQKRNKRIVEVYLQGELEVTQIAELFCVQARLVYRAVKAAGVPHRSPGTGLPVLQEVTIDKDTDLTECGGKLR